MIYSQNTKEEPSYLVCSLCVICVELSTLFKDSLKLGTMDKTETDKRKPVTTWHVHTWMPSPETCQWPSLVIIHVQLKVKATKPVCPWSCPHIYIYIYIYITINNFWNQVEKNVSRKYNFQTDRPFQHCCDLAIRSRSPKPKIWKRGGYQ